MLRRLTKTEPFKPDPDDFIIIVMGPTGCGKTNFINALTGNPEQRAAGNLKSDTRNVTPYTIQHQSFRLVLVDTPGFDDTYRPDMEILRIIADWLVQRYPNGTTLKIAGVIYVHRISDTRMYGSTRKVLQMFSQICGAVPLPRTRLVTTMWDVVRDQARAIQKEAELKTDFWRELIDKGATAHRFHNTPNSAWMIINDLLRMGNDGGGLLLQEELVEQRKHLSMTEAGKLLDDRLQKLLADERRIQNELAEESKQLTDPATTENLQKEREQIDAQLQKTFEEMKGMNVPLSRRIHLWLSGRKTGSSETLTSASRSLHPAASTLNNSRPSSSSIDGFKPDPDDFIILVMGPSGSGKTNFVNSLLGQVGSRSTENLKSGTQKVVPHRVTYGGVRLVLVEMPGFDDTYREDSEILTIIAEWVTQRYQDGTTLKIAGIIYLHRITDNRMSGSARQNLQMFGRLCGTAQLPRTRLVTSMWDQARDEAMAEQRETELINDFWRVLIDGGATPHRFQNTFESVQEILGSLLSMGLSGDELLLQEELVEHQKRLNETVAGKALYDRLQKLLADQRRTLKELSQEAKSQRDPTLARSLQEEREKINAQLQKTFEEMRAMKIPLSRRMVLWLSKRKTRSKTIDLSYWPA